MSTMTDRPATASTTRRRVTRGTVLATLGAAAVAGIAAGALLHRAAGPAAGPAGAGASTSTSTTRSSTTGATPPTTPASPSTSLVTTASPAGGPLSTANLMVAADYTAAGFSSARLQTGPGAGQATVTACQRTDPSDAPGVVTMFSANADGGTVYADEWALDFTSENEAQQFVASVDEWRSACTDADNAAMEGTTFSASEPRQVSLPDTSEGRTWSMDFEQDGHRLRQLVGVVRTGTRVAVVVASATPEVTDRVDGATLVEHAAQRLG